MKTIEVISTTYGKIYKVDDETFTESTVPVEIKSITETKPSESYDRFGYTITIYKY